MTIYSSNDEEPIFDFYSTNPPVFRIVVRPRDGYNGIFAEAEFRAGHHGHLWSVAAWSTTEDEALEILLNELKTRYRKASLMSVLVEFANLCRQYPNEPPLALLELALPGLGGGEVDTAVVYD